MLEISDNLLVAFEVMEHSLRVSLLSLLFSRRLGLDEQKISDITLGAMFHDMGKLQINPRILLKSDKLTSDEREYIETHCDYSYDIAKRLGMSETACDICLSHHESINCEGYPNKIILNDCVVNLVKLCDVYDALRSKRPYRGEMSCNKALDVMSQEKSNFDNYLFIEFRSFAVWYEGVLSANGLAYLDVNYPNLAKIKSFDWRYEELG